MHNLISMFGVMLVIVPTWLAGAYWIVNKFNSDYAFPAFMAATGIVLIVIGYFTGG